MSAIKAEIQNYIEEKVIPLYDDFDTAHQRSHVEKVIEEAMKLSNYYNINPNILYVAAAYHDTGLCEGRKYHHIASAKIIRNDSNLKQWFTPEEISLIADAAEDHRASSTHEPRSIYGRIIAEADRLIDPHTVIERTVQYGLSHYPELSKEQHYQRTIQHMKEKYDEGGYLKLWIPQSDNARRLEQLRAIIHNQSQLRELFEHFWQKNDL